MQYKLGGCQTTFLAARQVEGLLYEVELAEWVGAERARGLADMKMPNELEEFRTTCDGDVRGLLVPLDLEGCHMC